jgi:hypothetical protein
MWFDQLTVLLHQLDQFFTSFAVKWGKYTRREELADLFSMLHAITR